MNWPGPYFRVWAGSRFPGSKGGRGMSTIPTPRRLTTDYPTSDGKPMAETDWHRDLMFQVIDVLKLFFRDRPDVYVSGNLLVFYEPGNRRRHVSPDVFVVRGVGNHQRPNYLVWEERKGPEVVIEITSSSTRREDQVTKRTLYQDTLKVKEYFLFDPDGDWLDPPLQGYRLHKGVYRPIRAVHGRLPSQVLGLHLERDGRTLRLWNPETEAWLPTRAEQAEERADEAEVRADEAEARAEQEALARQAAEAEVARLRGLLGENGR
jgi:Uma2 family endonuclease